MTRRKSENTNENPPCKQETQRARYKRDGHGKAQTFRSLGEVLAVILPGICRTHLLNLTPWRHQ